MKIIFFLTCLIDVYPKNHKSQKCSTCVQEESLKYEQFVESDRSLLFIVM